MKLFYININTIGVTPLMAYIVDFLSSHFNSAIIERYIAKSYQFHSVKNKRYIKKHKDTYSFNRQNIIDKIYKYLYVLFVLLKLSFKRKSYIIYSVDFQVIALSLMLKKIFRKKKCKIIYHQFELIETKSLGKENLYFYKKLKIHSNLIDLIILPEKNRLNILLKELNFPKDKSFYFPNINAINKLSANKHEVINSIPKDTKIVGHIGSIGFDHYINNFIKATEILKNDKIKFIFVGKQNAEIKKLANKLEAQNIIFIDEVPHSELKDIYSFLDLGFILYKGVDENFEYCAPNKLYEYWAYGVPVIAHKLKGLQSEFNNEDAGVLINLENFKEIALYIKQYLKDNQREEIKKYYQLNYNMNDFLSRLLKRFKEL